MTVTAEIYLAAVATLSVTDFNLDGSPKMSPLNAALTAAGADEMTVQERDQMTAQIAAGDTPPEPETETQSEQPPADKQYMLYDSRYDPLTVPVNGKVALSMRIGDIKAVPDDVMRVAQDAGAVFKEINPEGKTNAKD